MMSWQNCHLEPAKRGERDLCGNLDVFLMRTRGLQLRGPSPSARLGMTGEDATPEGGRR